MAHMQGWEAEDDLYHPLDRQWEQPDGSIKIAFHIRGDDQLAFEYWMNHEAMK